MEAERNRMNVLQHVLLFTGLGIFSYWLLADYTELTTYIYETTTFVGALATTVILFNIFGFSVLFFSNWLMAGYPLYYVSKSRLTLNYVIVGAVLLAMNFAIFFCLKFIGGSETVFSIKARGLTLIFFIWFIEIVVITMMLFTNSMRYTMDLYRRNKQLEADSVKAHYAALQQQLNPHFLFNSLNTLVAEIEYDPPTAVEFTRNLSDVYRYVLQHQEQSTVTLGEEMEFAEAYIFLHRVRLGDCIELRSTVPAEYMDRRMPPLALQMLVENVVKHNLISEKSPVTISLSCDEAEGMLVVENNSCPKKNAPTSGKGLANLAERYRMLCGRGIKVESGEGYFRVSIPLLYE